MSFPRSIWIKGGVIRLDPAELTVSIWISGLNNPGKWLIDELIDEIHLSTPGADLNSILNTAKKIEQIYLLCMSIQTLPCKKELHDLRSNLTIKEKDG